MITPIRLAPSSTILATPASAGGFYARSTNAADTGTLYLTGPVGGTATNASSALQGLREIGFSQAFTALTLASLSASQLGTISILGSGAAGEGRIIALTQPANNDTLVIGLTGFTQTYTFKTTLTGSAYEVLRGADATETMANLRLALRDGDTVRGDATGEGTAYGTGTAANPYLDVTAVSGTILTVTDLIACRRSLAWSFTQGVGTTLSLQTPTGGTDGQVLAQLIAGQTLAANEIILDDEGLTLDRLPALVNFASSWITAGGRPATLYIRAENVTTPMACSYEISTDSANQSANAVAGSQAIADLDNNWQVLNIPERCEWFRLLINNTNTTAVSVNAKLVTGP